MITWKTGLAVVVIALWLPLFLSISALGGCQAGTTGLARPIDSNVEHSITNAVAIVSQTAGSALPQPFAAATEAAGAAVLALLAAWQGYSHTKQAANSAAIAALQATPKT